MRAAPSPLRWSRVCRGPRLHARTRPVRRVDFEEFKKIMLYKRARLLKVPSALFEDSAPCARPAAPKAQAARFDPH